MNLACRLYICNVHVWSAGCEQDADLGAIVHAFQVQEVVLVELKDAHVQHAANVRIILEQIAPSALLTVLSAEPS